MAGAEATGKLREYLDARLFQPILSINARDVEAGEQLAFAALQDRLRDQRDLLWSSGSAEELVAAFDRAWHSAEAVEARRGLARVGRPEPGGVWDGFVALARELGLEVGAEPDPLPELRPQAEARIRERARVLWDQDGRPTGREAEYLERARELEAMAAHPDAGLMPNPMAEADTPPGPEQPVEPVEQAVENQADVPGFMTDQGERPAEPTRNAWKSER